MKTLLHTFPSLVLLVMKIHNLCVLWETNCIGIFINEGCSDGLDGIVFWLWYLLSMKFKYHSQMKSLNNRQSKHPNDCSKAKGNFLIIECCYIHMLAYVDIIQLYTTVMVVVYSIVIVPFYSSLVSHCKHIFLRILIYIKWSRC